MRTGYVSKRCSDILICSSNLFMGRTMSWKTCFVKVMALIPGVVVNLRNAGLGGRSHPKSKRKRG